MLGLRTSLQQFQKHSMKWSSTMGIALFASGIVANGPSTNVTLCEEQTKENELNEKIALNPKEWRSFRLNSIQKLTPSTSLLKFDLPSKEHEMGLNVASCLMIRGNVNGKNVARPYTPINANDEKGTLQLAIKGYENGKLSKHLVHLQPGDEVEFKGPFQKFQYKANSHKHIGMVAGGSGITPMLQVLREILRNPMDQTQVTLIYANTSEEEIILRDEIDGLRHLYPKQLKVIYCLDNIPENETFEGGHIGYITEELLQEHLPIPSDDNIVYVCGPPPMMYHISGNKAKDKSQGELTGLLAKMNYKSSMVFKF